MGSKLYRGYNDFICQSSLTANDRNIIVINLNKIRNLLAYMIGLGNRHGQMGLEEAKNFFFLFPCSCHYFLCMDHSFSQVCYLNRV